MSERATKQPLNGLRLPTLLLLVLVAAPTQAGAAAWQYYVPFETGKTAKDGAAQPGKAFLWLPPEAKTIRGVLVGGQLGIELEIALAPEVRRACADSDLAIVYFVPHISGVFHYWAEGSTDRERWLKAFDDLARRSGHSELRRVPWITMGHSTAGIFCRNVAYAWPERVAGILHIKSGNFHQKDHLPPAGSLAGIPLVAMNGQFETFGPEGGLRPEFGRQTQWVFVRKDIGLFKERDPNELMSLWLDLGGDHFHGSPELSEYAAAFIRKTARYRIPASPPPGDDPVRCLPLKVEDGWLTDADLYDPAHPPAAYKDYTGDKQKAMWHYDREMAESVAQHHKNLGNHQCLSNPTLVWLDDGDGWAFRAKAEFLDAMPQEYGGSVAGKKIGHAAGPILYRAKISEPVEQIGPDTFRLMRPVKAVNVAAVHPGDEQYRATNRWASLTVPAVNGQPQSIDFPAVPDLKADGSGCDLEGRATSGLPVFYEVDYGPAAVKGARLIISDLPRGAVFPIECRVTAYQIGRRTGEAVAPAPPVARVFNVVEP
jgi:hypothetical protein